MNVPVRYLTPDSLGSFRDWLHDEGEAWFPHGKPATLVKDAVAALRGGRCFDFGVVPRGAELDSYADAAVALVEQGIIGLPYGTFVGLARFVETGGEDGIVMIVAETDDGLRPHRFLHFSAGTPARRRSLLNLRRIGYDDGGHYFMPFDFEGREGEDAKTERQFRRLALLLGLIADQRIPHTHIEAPTSLNTARRARGRPPIPASWKIDASAWVTRVGHRKGHDENRGGHHRSPVAHDRRGHQRRLSSGKVTWVRSTRVGELLKHLTRHREFYASAKGEAK